MFQDLHTSNEIDIFQVIPLLEAALEEIEQETKDDYYVQQVLLCYNDIRQACDFPRVQSIAEADIQWLRWQHYQLWKESFEKKLIADGLITIEDQHYCLTELVGMCLRQSKNDQDGIYSRFALYYYNFLRELAQLAPVESCQEIDEAWMRARDYEVWQSHLRKEWNEAAGDGPWSVLEEQENLIWQIDRGLCRWHESLEKDDYALKEVLYAYTFLRTYTELPPVTSALSIDLTRLKAHDYVLWKKMQQEQWQQDGVNDVEEQQIVLVTGCQQALEELLKNPENNEVRREFLYTYNSLREHAGLSPADNVDCAHTPWIHEYSCALWKEEIKRIVETDEGERHEQQFVVVQLAEDVLGSLEHGVDQEDIGRIMGIYNFLRERSGLSLASSTAQIDIPWLKAHNYQLWKTMMKKFLRVQGLTSVKVQHYHLAQWTLQAMKSLQADPDHKGKEKDLVYKYNFLCELLQLPLVTSHHDIQPAWVRKITRELKSAINT